MKFFRMFRIFKRLKDLETAVYGDKEAMRWNYSYGGSEYKPDVFNRHSLRSIVGQLMREANLEEVYTAGTPPSCYIQKKEKKSPKA